MALSINFGLKSYPIEDEDGNVLGAIRFNPSDVGLATRWESARKAIKEATDTMPKSGDGMLEALGELDTQVKAQLDYAFGTPVSAVLFQQVSSLALCGDGRMVIENVLDALAPVVEEAQQTAVKAGEARVKAKTAKYEGTTRGLAPGQK